MLSIFEVLANPEQIVGWQLGNKETLMRKVEITKQPVELYKILKFEGLVSTGGEAKLLIADGQVTVNGEVETRRRRKIIDGDVIEFREERLQIEAKLQDSAETAK
jgi:ribosome-associated protein